MLVYPMTSLSNVIINWQIGKCVKCGSKNEIVKIPSSLDQCFIRFCSQFPHFNFHIYHTI